MSRGGPYSITISIPVVCIGIDNYRSGLCDYISLFVGHLLYEVGSGRELTVGCPTEDDLASVRHPSVADVLRFIFYNESGEMPSISEVCCCCLVSDVIIVTSFC